MWVIGWLLIGLAFVFVVTVANNSWKPLWDKFTAAEGASKADTSPPNPTPQQKPGTPF